MHQQLNTKLFMINTENIDMWEIYLYGSKSQRNISNLNTYMYTPPNFSPDQTPNPDPSFKPNTSFFYGWPYGPCRELRKGVLKFPIGISVGEKKSKNPYRGFSFFSIWNPGCLQETLQNYIWLIKILIVSSFKLIEDLSTLSIIN